MRQVVIILAIQHSRPKVHLGLTTHDLDFALASFDSTSQSAPSCKIMCFCSWIVGEKPCAIPNETLLRVIYLSVCLSFHSNFFFPLLNSSTRSCFRAQVAQDHQAGHWPRVVRVCMVLMLMVVRILLVTMMIERSVGVAMSFGVCFTWPLTKQGLPLPRGLQQQQPSVSGAAEEPLVGKQLNLIGSYRSHVDRFTLPTMLWPAQNLTFRMPHTKNNKLPTHAYGATAQKDLCIWIGKRVGVIWVLHDCSVVFVPSNLQSWEVLQGYWLQTQCQDLKNECKQIRNERKQIREESEEAGSSGNGAGRNFPKGSRNMPPTKTAYRLGFVVPGDVVKWFQLQPKPLKLLIYLRLSKSCGRRCGAQLQAKGQDRTTCFAEKICPN